jgi:hypothetical protein
MAQFILAGYCKSCGSPIFVEGELVAGAIGQVIESKDKPKAIRTCGCCPMPNPR